MAIGDIRPQEIQATTEEDPQGAAVPISADVPDATLQQTPTTTPACGSAAPLRGTAPCVSGTTAHISAVGCRSAVT